MNMVYPSLDAGQRCSTEPHQEVHLRPDHGTLWWCLIVGLVVHHTFAINFTQMGLGHTRDQSLTIRHLGLSFPRSCTHCE